MLMHRKTCLIPILFFFFLRRELCFNRQILQHWCYSRSGGGSIGSCSSSSAVLSLCKKAQRESIQEQCFQIWNQVSRYSKTCVKRPLSKRLKIGLQDQLSLNAGQKYCRMLKSIAECSKGSILQYFWPALSCHLSLRSLFCLFSSDRFTQVLL